MKKIVLLLVLSSMCFKLSVAPPANLAALNCGELLIEAAKQEKARIEAQRRQLIIESIIEQESNGRPLAYNAPEQAAGILQIRPIMIREVNRLVGYEKYFMRDRWSPEASINVFIDYQNAVNPSWDPEQAARRWNGGYTGHLRPTTIVYWLEVKKIFEAKCCELEENRYLYLVNI